jgi:hypothetical protein
MHPKVQHYVPQFYLRGFATRRKKQYFVYCFDKATGNTFKPNVKNVAGETGFYDFTTDDGKKKSIEEFLSRMETESKTAFETIVCSPSANTVATNKSAFAIFFAFQMSRAIVFRSKYLDSIEGVNLKLKNDGIVFPIPTENELKEFQAFFLLRSTPLFADVLLKMKWILVLNRTGKHFWTSDNPIIRYNPQKCDLASNLGLLSKGIQLHVPLNPELALILCDPNEYAKMRPEIVAIQENVAFNNSGQVIQSRQYLFSIENDFELAKGMIQKNPELGDPDRQRVIVN